MKVETVRGMFSQFSDGLDVKASHEGASISEHLCKNELADFALQLMDVADDCLQRLEYEKAQELLAEARCAVYEAKRIAAREVV